MTVQECLSTLSCKGWANFVPWLFALKKESPQLVTGVSARERTWGNMCIS